ncbi:MAG: FtsX-like permease family protein [Odoribacter sp.]
MHLSLFIAQRYLFSKKKQNAINIISAISIIGVTIGTTALIVILSIFNGIDLILQKSTDSFTPDIVISPISGKFTNFDSTIYRFFRQHPTIAYHNNIIEEKALVKYGDKLSPVTVKGVESDYAENTHFTENIVEGEFQLKSGDHYKSVVGYGVAAELGIGLNFLTPLIFYYPDKESATSVPSLHTEYLYPSAFFSSQQEIDGQYVLTDLAFAQQLFGVDDKISKIEIKLIHESFIPEIKKELKAQNGEKYRIEDKFELNKAFYAMMKSEKLAVFLILLFILLIASFNIIGSISMLILDKKEDLSIYKAMGMTNKNLISIFKTEGNLITLAGATFGLILGTVICLLQEKYGFITLGDGSYIISAYPVKIVINDILLIIATVLLIGYTASYFPVKYLVNKLTR